MSTNLRTRYISAGPSLTEGGYASVCPETRRYISKEANNYIQRCSFLLLAYSNLLDPFRSFLDLSVG